MIYLGTDHRGFALKEKIKTWLTDWGYQFEDLGNAVLDPEDDYPDFAAQVARRVAENPAENQGIVLCGSGIGVDVVANKFKGVRSALLWSDDANLAQMAREHDDTNVLSLPADYLSEEAAQRIVRTWIETPPGTHPRFIRRLEKIKAIEG